MPVKQDKADVRLDELSRINFGKIYTIEHNLKVKPFGIVSNTRDLLRGVATVREEQPETNVTITPVGRPGGSSGNQQTASRQSDRPPAALSQREQALAMARAAKAKAREEEAEDEDEEESDESDEDDVRTQSRGAAQPRRQSQGQQGYYGYQRSQR